MSAKHPIISVTGSSGAGTTSVRKTFETIFRREEIKAAFIEGDAFHRYDREEMQAEVDKATANGNSTFSHFGSEANLLKELETAFRTYGDYGTAQTRHYVHDPSEAKEYGAPVGKFTEWKDLPFGSDLLFYEGLHGGAITDEVNIARFVELMIGVVPVIN